MQAYHLIHHPASSPVSVNAIEARVGLGDPDWLHLRWRIEAADKVAFPAITSKRRADGLWQTSCFELFLRPEGGEFYQEWNFSPSRQWNLYGFTAPRQGMAQIETACEPDCVLRPGSKFALFDAYIPRSELPNGSCAMGLSAVIEEAGGAKSYWALLHPGGDAPDFHDPACFAATLDPRSTL